MNNDKELERRRKISEKMKYNFKIGKIKGWKINSDKKRRSYPEKFFIEVFKNNNLYNKFEIIEKHSYGKYFIDFLFVEIKLIVEIDGEQHYKDQESINHDIIRDDYFIKEGFKIYRIRWKDVFNNTKVEIEEFLNFLSNIENKSIRKYDISNCLYEKKEKKKNLSRKNSIKKKKCDNCESLVYKTSKVCRSCWILKKKNSIRSEKYIPLRKNKCEICNEPIYGKKNCLICYHKASRTTERPPIEKLLKDVEELGYSGTGRKYNVSDNAIRKWIKNTLVS